MIDFFEEGWLRRFMSCDKAEDELMELLEFPHPPEAHVLFWEGYRWSPPETKQKTMKKIF